MSPCCACSLPTHLGREGFLVPRRQTRASVAINKHSALDPARRPRAGGPLKHGKGAARGCGPALLGTALSIASHEYFYACSVHAACTAAAASAAAATAAATAAQSPKHAIAVGFQEGLWPGS